MRAMRLHQPGWNLVPVERPVPVPAGHDLLLRVRVVRKGGTVVCAGIHMSEVPAFAYERLWGDRVLRSVANPARADGEAFFAAIARHPIRTHVTPYPLARANAAVADLRAGRIDGAAVLVP